MSKNLVTKKKVLELVAELVEHEIEDYMSSGDLNLTALEEKVQEELEIDEEVFEDMDFSFEIFTYLQKRGIITHED